nr:hypothetical protein CFP56_17335 [Quercus suber]
MGGLLFSGTRIGVNGYILLFSDSSFASTILCVSAPNISAIVAMVSPSVLYEGSHGSSPGKSDDGLGVGGDDLGGCEVVGFGEEGNISAQELADGQWRTVSRSGSEREVGLATGFDAVAFKPIRDF